MKAKATSKHKTKPPETKTKQKLTWLQESFCRAYVKDPTNQTKAARTAGYKGTEPNQRAIACRLIRNVNISQRIQEIREEAAAISQIDVNWCLKEAVAGVKRCKWTDETNAKGYLDQVSRMLGAFEADNTQRSAQTFAGMALALIQGNDSPALIDRQAQPMLEATVIDGDDDSADPLHDVCDDDDD